MGGGGGGGVGGSGGDGGPSNFTPKKKKKNKRRSVKYTDEDISSLGDFQAAGIHQHLIDSGLVKPFEFKIPSLATSPGEGLSSVSQPDYMSPSMFKQLTGYDYDSAIGKGIPESRHVKNWMDEVRASRENQYFAWKTDYGHFLGGAGTRLASRFDQEEATLDKKTLLTGSSRGKKK